MKWREKLVWIGVGVIIGIIASVVVLQLPSLLTHQTDLVFKQIVQIQTNSFGLGFEKNYTSGEVTVAIVAHYTPIFVPPYTLDYTVDVYLYSPNPNDTLLIHNYLGPEFSSGGPGSVDWAFLHPQKPYQPVGWWGICSDDGTLTIYLYEASQPIRF
jgi:hypothetical protein